MAELTRRLHDVIEDLRRAEKAWPPHTDGRQKVESWRETVEEALAILDSGRLQVVASSDSKWDPRTIAIEAMRNASRDLRWGLSPDEWIEFVATGGLYASVFDAVVEAWDHAGYEVVRRIG